MMGQVPLSGGIANAGAVSRVGDVVHRPSSAYTPSVQRFLRDVRSSGFTGVPEPLEPGPDGAERLTFIPGRVAAPPYPEWAQSDEALVSVAQLMRRCHDAASEVATDGEWSVELADPSGDAHIVCHNDVCLENVVFRDGSAVALLDWEFAAPGRRIYDLAQMARMCVPLTDDDSARRLGWVDPDRPSRLRLVCDAYGVDAAGRSQLIVAADDAIRVSTDVVRRRVDAGDPNFTAMWTQFGGSAWLHRRQQWWADNRSTFRSALT